MDEDLLVVSSFWLKTGRRFHGVVYAHQMQITIGRAIQVLELMAKVLEPDEMLDRIERLPL